MSQDTDDGTRNVLREQVEIAAARADVREAVAQVYADLQATIDARRPACVASGRCCRFEEFGHRLYVTTLELGAFLHAFRARPAPDHPAAEHSAPDRSTVSLPQAWDETGCPFQAQRLCGVHAIRPFGCRVFFCDASAGQWQNDVYEQFHSRLKRLHEEMAVPYLYVEWRHALRQLGLAPTGART